MISHSGRCLHSSSSLLELQPQLGDDGQSLVFASEAAEQKGNQRKTTGSYYTPNSRSASWVVEVRSIDDDGLALGGWIQLASGNHSAATNTPIRLSYKYAVAPGRYHQGQFPHPLRHAGGGDRRRGDLRDLMKKIVNRLYTFQMRIDDPEFQAWVDRWAAVAEKGDDPELQDFKSSASRRFP